MGWETTMKAAEAAKSRMLSDRSLGETAFARLLDENQGDGMIYFQRGLAYESLDEKALAIKDFKSAHALFPKTEWKQLAKEALQRLTPKAERKRIKRKVAVKKLSSNNTAKERRVWVVHGRDERLRTAVFTFIRSIDLNPLEFSEARKLTQKSAPYVGEILDVAFKHAQAVVVLLTPDDQAQLRPDLRRPSDEHFEKELTGQARPNVLFEAGMALVSHPQQTVLVQIGYVRPFSDVAGKHIVHMDGSIAARQELASRLEDAGCPVNWRGKDWHTAGDLNPFALPTKNPALSDKHNRSSDLEELINARDDNYGVTEKLLEALRHPQFKWRTIQKVAAAAAVTEERAVMLLRLNSQIRFSTSKKGKTIVGLKARIG